MKVYIKYYRPYKNEDDEPPIEEVWGKGEKPEKSLADSSTLYVYDCDSKNMLDNERLWDGQE